VVGGGVGVIGGTVTATAPVGAVDTAAETVPIAGLVGGTADGSARPGSPATSDARTISVPVNTTTRTAPTAMPTVLPVLNATTPVARCPVLSRLPEATRPNVRGDAPRRPQARPSTTPVATATSQRPGPGRIRTGHGPKTRWP